MKPQTRIFAVCAVLAWPLCRCSLSPAGTYSGGSGTSEDPYKIATVADLNAAGTNPTDWDKHFIIISDLDCQGTTLSMLGTGEIPFSGAFDGNGHRIVNITQPLFDRVHKAGHIHHLGIQAMLSGEKSAGLVRINFGSFTDCSVNIAMGQSQPLDSIGGLVIWNYGTLENCSVTGQIGCGKTVGGLVAWNYGLLMNCSVEEQIMINDQGFNVEGTVIGGLAGQNHGELFHCSNKDSVWYAVHGMIGGLVGLNAGTVRSCSFEGTDYYSYRYGPTGGLIGENNGNLEKSSFKGGFIAFGEGGGLAAYNNGTISQCQMEGRIGIWGSGGGLAARNWGLIRDSYARGQIGAEGGFGGIAGINGGTMINCFAAGRIAEPFEGPGGGLIRERGTECHMEEFCEGCGDGEICCQWWPVCEPVGEEIASFSDLCFWYNCDPDLTGPNTEAMQVKATYTDAGWDFLGECANGTYDRWRMCVNGVDYPHLNWEFSQRGDFLCPNGTAMEDLAYLAKRWMANTPARIGVADINGDGKVNLNDFAILASHWLQG